MNEEWYTAREMAEMGLPELPNTERGVQKIAAREAWPRRKRAGRGGGWEYPPEALPARARAEVAKLQVARLIQPRREGAVPIQPTAVKPAHEPREGRETNNAIAVPGAPASLDRHGEGRRGDAALSDRHGEGRRGDTAKRECFARGARDVQLPEKYRRVGLARAAAVGAFRIERTCAKSAGGGATRRLRAWVESYNRGEILADVSAVAGRASLARLYEWDRRLREGGLEAISGYRRPHNLGRRKVSELEEARLRELLLHPNRITPSDAARRTRREMLRAGRPASSTRTLLRWVEEYRRTHHGIWVMAREGEKAFADKVGPIIRRDAEELEVGELLVADGHVLNAMALNPYTGKPGRMTLIMWMDMRSRMPLGWEIMPTESTQGIHASLFSAILTLGKLPAGVLLDNGRAFKGMAFTGGWDGFTAEARGLYAELGIETHFAMPYNARSKPIEPFFKTLNAFERRLPGYCGRSTEDKPALMRRNEGRVREIFGRETPFTAEEISQALRQWCGEYARRPHRGLGNRTPLEIFEAGRGPGLDPAQLAARMLLCRQTTVRNCQVWAAGTWFECAALLDVSGPVTVRYTLGDLRRAWVFDERGGYLGEAARVTPAPFVARGDDFETVKTRIREQKRTRKAALGAVREIVAEDALVTLMLKSAGEAETELYRTPAPPEAGLGERFLARADCAELVAMFERSGDAASEECFARGAREVHEDEDDRREREKRWEWPLMRYEYLDRIRGEGRAWTADQAAWAAEFEAENPRYMRMRQAFGLTDEEAARFAVRAL